MDTSTGLLAIVPILPPLHEGHALVAESLALAKASPEINKTVLMKAEVGEGFYFSVLETVKSAEKKEGEKYRLVLILNPEYSSFTQENIMECFQRLIVDGLSDGIVSVDEKGRGKTWNVDDEGYLFDMDMRSVWPLALWKRDVLDQGIKTTKELRVIPYPSTLPVAS